MRKKQKRIVILALSLAALVVIAAGVLLFVGGKGLFIGTFASVDVSGQMEAWQFRAPNGIVLPYRIYVPEDYDSETEYPLLLFLHGSGERGNDNLAQVKKNSVMQTLLNEKNRKDYPCVVLAPQCPEEQRWFPRTEEDNDFSIPNALMALLEDTKKNYSIDTGRIYITGLSMGGYGTWGLLTGLPNYFAAAVPICGGGNPEQIPGNLAQVPIWVFHGKRDSVVDVENSREMVQALKDIGSTVVKYTEYPWENHACWELAYREADLFPWLFAQSKS